jgi:hypothetical protein
MVVASSGHGLTFEPQEYFTWLALTSSFHLALSILFAFLRRTFLHNIEMLEASLILGG